MCIPYHTKFMMSRKISRGNYSARNEKSETCDIHFPVWIRDHILSKRRGWVQIAEEFLYQSNSQPFTGQDDDSHLKISDELFSNVSANSLAAVEGMFLRHRPVQRGCLAWRRHLDV